MSQLAMHKSVNKSEPEGNNKSALGPERSCFNEFTQSLRMMIRYYLRSRVKLYRESVLV